MIADIDLDHVVREVTGLFDEYEAALVAGDEPTMARLFWASPLVLRFGTADAQSGHEELSAWRAARGPLPPGRTLSGTRVVAFGEDTAVATTTFTYPGRAMLGRQTQVWIRMPEGWRIVSAHVSEIPEPPGEGTEAGV